MPVFVSLVVSLGVMTAAVVKTDQAPLRSGCDAYSDLIANLPQGAALSIRYALSGESVPCYKVAAEANGKTVEGFLPASAIDGLEDFENSRRAANWLDTPKVMEVLRTATPTPPKAGSAAQQAAQLIESNRPLKAQELLEGELKVHKDDPNLMALAGVAAWKSDDARRALDYWRASLALQPNARLQTLYSRVEQESKGDKSNQRVYGMRVLLRYESPAVSADTARQMAAVLDEELTRISTELGCSPDERIIAIAQSNDAYKQTTGTAEWSAGQFDGRIRVPVFDGNTLTAATRRTLAHETAHACLTLLGQWPAWLHEGIAQKLSGDTLSPEVKEKIATMVREGKLPTLDQLGSENWSHMTTEQAQYAYAMALDAVEIFCKDYAAFGLRNLMRSPDRLPEITADLNRKLGL
ncbi:MAG: hypothetical protein ACRD5L_07070 [Bryobacteraceae bacterium]